MNVPIVTPLPFKNLNILRGTEAAPYFNEIVSLRLAYYGEPPYCYKGDLLHEKKYLRPYFSSSRSRVLVIRNEREVLIGAAIYIPLGQECFEVQEPFLSAGIGMEEFFYFGGYMLSGVAWTPAIEEFFCLWGEQFANEQGFSCNTFMHIEPEGKALGVEGQARAARMPDEQALREVWKKLGYKKTDYVSQIAWVRSDTNEEAEHRLSFWVKGL